MSDTSKKPEIVSESEPAFEMIELAIDDIDVLARAFRLISEVCAENDQPEVHLSELPERVLLN